eukprot:UC1_evm1s1027
MSTNLEDLLFGPADASVPASVSVAPTSVQQSYVATLERTYEDLLKKHAVAEATIDLLRIRGSVRQSPASIQGSPAPLSHPAAGAAPTVSTAASTTNASYGSPSLHNDVATEQILAAARKAIYERKQQRDHFEAMRAELGALQEEAGALRVERDELALALAAEQSARAEAE